MARDIAGRLGRGAGGRQSRGLQVALWTVWTGTVAATAAWYFLASAPARAFSPIGLAVHCALAGLLGLVVMTIVEMRLEPWRF